MTRRRYVCPRCNREAWAVRILRMCPWPKCGYQGEMEAKKR